MRHRWSVLGLALLLFGCDKGKESEGFHPLETNTSPRLDSDLKREIDFAYGLMPTNNPLSTAHLPSYRTSQIHYVHRSFSDFLFSMINPEAFQKYEGSYTAGEFEAERDSEAPAFSLSSSWVLHNKKLPKTGIKVAKNPETGNYEVSGGEVFFQEKGVGVSYEKDESTGETKTFLNFQKDF